MHARANDNMFENYSARLNDICIKNCFWNVHFEYLVNSIVSVSRKQSVCLARAPELVHQSIKPAALKL